MDAGTGKGYTHKDHPALAHQLFASYARANKVRVLASVMGVEGLPENDRKFLEFGDAFETRFVAQDGPRTLEQTMALGWELLRALPPSEMTRLSSAQLAEYIEGNGDTPHFQEEMGSVPVSAEGSGY